MFNLRLAHCGCTIESIAMSIRAKCELGAFANNVSQVCVVLCTDGSAAAVFDAKHLWYRNAPAADSLNKLSKSGPSKPDGRATASLKKSARR